MDTIIGELVDIRKEFLLEVQKMTFGLYGYLDGIYGLPGHPLTLQGNCAIVDEGLESLPVFALKHHLPLLPSSLSVISFFSIDVKGFQVIYGSGAEDFLVLHLLGGVKS